MAATLPLGTPPPHAGDPIPAVDEISGVDVEGQVGLRGHESDEPRDPIVALATAAVEVAEEHEGELAPTGSVGDARAAHGRAAGRARAAARSAPAARADAAPGQAASVRPAANAGAGVRRPRSGGPAGATAQERDRVQGDEQEGRRPHMLPHTWTRRGLGARGERVGQRSCAPMSVRAPRGRVAPRRSNGTIGLSSPASIAGLESCSVKAAVPVVAANLGSATELTSSRVENPLYFVSHSANGPSSRSLSSDVNLGSPPAT